MKHIKILLVGESGVGKSCLNDQIKNSLSQEKIPFSDVHIPSLGTDFCEIPYNSHLKLELFDSAGIEKFRSSLHACYEQCSLVYLVVDWTSQSSFDSLKHWKTEIDHYCEKYANKPCEVFLIVNKMDCDQKGVMSKDDITKLASDSGIEPTHIQYVSVKTDTNVKIMLDYTIETLQRAQAEARSTGNLVTENESHTSASNFSVNSLDVAQNGYIKRIYDLKSQEKPINDYEIVIQLMEDYCNPYIFGIANRTFKKEMQILISLARTGYFEGSTQKLIDAIKGLMNDPRYNDVKTNPITRQIQMSDTKRLIDALEYRHSYPENCIFHGFFDQNLFSIPIKAPPKSIMRYFKSDQRKLEAIYQKVIDDHKRLSRYDLLCKLLETYIGSTLSFHWRTHKCYVENILTLAKYDFEKPLESYYQHNAEDLYHAIMALRNIQACNSSEGDLAALLAVIENNRDALIHEKKAIIRLPDDSAFDSRPSI